MPAVQRVQVVHLTLNGRDASAHRMKGMEFRMEHPTPAVFDELFSILEHGEQLVFRRLRGKFVRTGDTKRSLTERHAANAIRDMHSDGKGMTFGTSVWYARFLKKGTRSTDAQMGTTSSGKRKHRKDKRLKSAVLVVTPYTRRQMRQAYMKYVMGEQVRLR